jgi:hypothetical protein
VPETAGASAARRLLRCTRGSVSNGILTVLGVASAVFVGQALHATMDASNVTMEEIAYYGQCEAYKHAQLNAALGKTGEDSRTLGEEYRECLDLAKGLPPLVEPPRPPPAGTINLNGVLESGKAAPVELPTRW